MHTSKIVSFGSYTYASCPCSTHLKKKVLKENHRNLEWPELEGTLQIIFQTLFHEQGSLPVDQAAQNFTHPNLEHFHRWGTHSFFRQLGPVIHHPHSKNFLFRSNLHLSFSFNPFPLVLSPHVLAIVSQSFL